MHLTIRFNLCINIKEENKVHFLSFEIYNIYNNKEITFKFN